MVLPGAECIAEFKPPPLWHTTESMQNVIAEPLILCSAKFDFLLTFCHNFPGCRMKWFCNTFCIPSTLGKIIGFQQCNQLRSGTFGPTCHVALGLRPSENWLGAEQGKSRPIDYVS